jgi:catalase (peroxidase I)
MDERETQTEAKCPFHHANGAGRSNRDWWPEQLNVGILHQHSSLSNPMGEEFNYAEAFKSLDLDAVIQAQDPDDGFPGLVAGGLRTPRGFVHSHGVP